MRIAIDIGYTAIFGNGARIAPITTKSNYATKNRKGRGFDSTRIAVSTKKAWCAWNHTNAILGHKVVIAEVVNKFNSFSLYIGVVSENWTPKGNGGFDLSTFHQRAYNGRVYKVEGWAFYRGVGLGSKLINVHKLLALCGLGKIILEQNNIEIKKAQ